MATSKKSPWTLARVLPWLLLIGGAISLFASLALSVEKFSKLAHPHAAAICDLNPILSCSTVASSHQSEAFGFYNPFLGLAGFGAVMAIGLALLAGAQFKRWFWQVVEAGLLFATGF